MLYLIIELSETYSESWEFIRQLEKMQPPPLALQKSIFFTQYVLKHVISYAVLCLFHMPDPCLSLQR